MSRATLEQLLQHDDFARRHIGPGADEQHATVVGIVGQKLLEHAGGAFKIGLRGGKFARELLRLRTRFEKFRKLDPLLQDGV